MSGEFQKIEKQRNVNNAKKIIILKRSENDDLMMTTTMIPKYCFSAIKVQMTPTKNLFLRP